jgi:hypothetical protein
MRANCTPQPARPEIDKRGKGIKFGRVEGAAGWAGLKSGRTVELARKVGAARRERWPDAPKMAGGQVLLNDREKLNDQGWCKVFAESRLRKAVVALRAVGNSGGAPGGSLSMVGRSKWSPCANSTADGAGRGIDRLLTECRSSVPRELGHCAAELRGSKRFSAIPRMV